MCSPDFLFPRTHIPSYYAPRDICSPDELNAPDELNGDMCFPANWHTRINQVVRE